jgi:hypothetical protein
VKIHEFGAAWTLARKAGKVGFEHKISHIHGKVNTRKHDIFERGCIGSARLRLFADAILTCENSRSTEADVAGQPRYSFSYWRAITATFGNFL